MGEPLLEYPRIRFTSPLVGPLWERSDRIDRCDPAEGSGSVSSFTSSRIETPSGAIADAKHRRRTKNGGLKAAYATFSHKGRRETVSDVAF